MAVLCQSATLSAAELESAQHGLPFINTCESFLELRVALPAASSSMPTGLPNTFSPSSDDLSSIAETVRTFSTTSTHWGPGALTGKALKAFGGTSLDFLCRVLIRRRLAVIRQTLEKSPSALTNPSSAKEWRQRDAIYTNLDELCRGDYPIALRIAAAHLLRDIVSLIGRFLAEESFDDFQISPNPRRLTSLFSPPMHTQWASLLSHIQHHYPYLLLGHGPSISVNKWTSGPLTQEPVEVELIGISDGKNFETEVYLVNSSKVPEPRNRTSITVMMRVEVTQSQHVQDDPKMSKALAMAFRAQLSKAINSRHQQDRNSRQTITTEAQDEDGPTEYKMGPSSIDQEPKVLVLGTGGAGKSTLLEQQARAFPGNPRLYTRQVAAEVIINNTIASMKSLLLSIPLSELHHSSLLANRYLQELPLPSYTVESFSPKQLNVVGCMIRSLWQDPVVRKAAQTQRALLSDDSFVVPDSLEYFGDSVDRIFTPNYKPTLHDASRSRVRTIGVHETVLTSNTYPMRFIDTGGEPSERRKWLHHFENVTVVVFVVALSDYNRSFHDTGSSSVNRMDDSVRLFNSIVNSPHFESSLIILIFNKGDVFAKELDISPLDQWMPDYTGKTYDDACQHIESRFINLINDKSRAVRIHYTTAIDEKTMMARSITIRDEITRHHQQQQLGTYTSCVSSSGDTHLPAVISQPSPE